jgi:hypothetical protein
MSRTACCFLALGISVAAFAAACGDDDDGGGGIGGNGGSGASGGSGGSAGSAGSGDAGSAGSAGGGAGGSSGGSAGTGNAGSGNAGTSAGQAGSGSAGAAGDGSDGGVPDSGIVDEPDSGVVVDAGPDPDSGLNGDCPDFATATAQTVAQTSQPVAIVRVTFNAGGTATVVLRGTDGFDPGGFTTGDIQAICTGPDDGDCSDPDDLGTLPALLALNAEVTLTVPGMVATEGELVLATGLPSDIGSSTFAYVAWGTDFVSEAPVGGVGLLSWEDRALLDGFWTLDDRIDVGATQNTFICGGATGNADNGDTSLAAGFGICTADQF